LLIGVTSTNIYSRFCISLKQRKSCPLHAAEYSSSSGQQPSLECYDRPVAIRRCWFVSTDKANLKYN
jgi:hypothetical protein